MPSPVLWLRRQRPDAPNESRQNFRVPQPRRARRRGRVRLQCRRGIMLLSDRVERSRDTPEQRLTDGHLDYARCERKLDSSFYRRRLRHRHQTSANETQRVLPPMTARISSARETLVHQCLRDLRQLRGIKTHRCRAVIVRTERNMLAIPTRSRTCFIALAAARGDVSQMAASQ